MSLMQTLILINIMITSTGISMYFQYGKKKNIFYSLAYSQDLNVNSFNGNVYPYDRNVKMSRANGASHSTLVQTSSTIIHSYFLNKHSCSWSLPTYKAMVHSYNANVSTRSVKVYSYSIIVHSHRKNMHSHSTMFPTPGMLVQTHYTNIHSGNTKVQTHTTNIPTNHSANLKMSIH